MGFWKVATFIGAAYFVGKVVKSCIDGKKEQEEEENRRNTPCYFCNGITEKEFQSIVYKNAKIIKRVKVDVDGPIVYGTVRSQSGISYWNFRIDYNDWGKVTGRYWLYSDNNDSSIPDTLGDRISDEVSSRLNSYSFSTTGYYSATNNSIENYNPNSNIANNKTHNKKKKGGKIKDFLLFILIILALLFLSYHLKS